MLGFGWIPQIYFTEAPLQQCNMAEPAFTIIYSTYLACKYLDNDTITFFFASTVYQHNGYEM